MLRLNGDFINRQEIVLSPVGKIEKSLLVIKPDAFQQNKVKEILGHLTANGFELKYVKDFHMTSGQAGMFYAEHGEKEFFKRTCNAMASGTCVAVVVERHRAIEKLRKLVGASKSWEAEPGTLRFLYGSKTIDCYNAVHASDSEEAFKREIFHINCLNYFDPYKEI